MSELTDRDVHIIAQALDSNGWSFDRLKEMPKEAQETIIVVCLYDFVRWQQLLSEETRNRSDEEDAKATLGRIFPERLKALIELDQRAGTKPPNFFVRGDEGDPRV
jgi:hypothetical protein